MLRLETIICTFSLLSVASRADFKARNCSEVREACAGRGFSFAHVPLQEIPGKKGHPRPSGFTTCQSVSQTHALNRRRRAFHMLKSGGKNAAERRLYGTYLVCNLRHHVAPQRERIKSSWDKLLNLTCIDLDKVLICKKATLI